MSMRPVSKQTTTVSQNVPVMETSAWRAGFFVVAEDATNGAEPMPDSLEKIPRLKPNCKASVTVEPTAPPAAPAGVKAPTIIWRIASPRNWPFMPMMMMQHAT